MKRNILLIMLMIIIFFTILIIGNNSFAATNKEVQVYFNGNGGTTNSIRKTVNYQSTYGKLPTATRIGYTFNGWYTYRIEGKQVTEETVVNKSYSHVLYAHWTIDRTYTSAELKEELRTRLYSMSTNKEAIEKALEIIKNSSETDLVLDEEKIQQIFSNINVDEIMESLEDWEKTEDIGTTTAVNISQLRKILEIIKAFPIDQNLAKSITIDTKAIIEAIDIKYKYIVLSPIKFARVLKPMIETENKINLFLTPEGQKILKNLSPFVEIDIDSILKAVQIDVNLMLKSLKIKYADFDKLFENEKISKLLGECKHVIKEMLKNEEIVDAYLLNLDKQRQGIISGYDVVTFLSDFGAYLTGATNASSTGTRFNSIADFVTISHNSTSSPTDEQRIAEGITISKAELHESKQDTVGQDIYLIRLAPTMMIGSCGVEEDILVAMGTYNEYLYNVEKAINEHGIPEGANIVVTGASLGGMEAQQIAAVLKYKYNFKYVIGIESGYILQNEMSQNTKVVLTEIRGDLVTVLPLYAIFEKNIAVGQYKILSPENETNTRKYKTVAGAHIGGCLDNSFWEKYDALGNDISNGAYIELLESPSYYAANKNQAEYLKLIENGTKEISFANVQKAWDKYVNTDPEKETTMEKLIEQMKEQGIQVNEKTPYTYMTVGPSGEKIDLLIINTNTDSRYVFIEKQLNTIDIDNITDYEYSKYDLDFNKKVTLNDYAIIKRYMLKDSTLSIEEALYYLDFNGNGIITIFDARMILKRSK